MKPEELLELFRQRQSVRAFVNNPIGTDKLMRCIEAARLAPSACNAQPWKFIIVDEPELKNKLADLTSNKLLPLNHFTKQAPVHIVIVQEPANFTSTIGQVIKNKDYPLMDIGIAAIQLCLQATVEGLSSCILGWFNEKEVRKLLNIPKNKRVELIILLGYAASGEVRQKIRKDTDKILSYNTY